MNTNIIEVAIKVVTLLVIIACSGCTNLAGIVRNEQQIPITVHNDGNVVKESGAMFLWPPYSSAAIVDKEGNRCVLTASGSKTIDASTEAAIKLGKAFEKIDGLDASSKAKITEAFTKLSASGAQSTFLDVALFQLCMFEQNGAFKYVDSNGRLIGKSQAIMEAYKLTLDTAKSIQ
nr:hypothetical protein [uncultured Undibacterium sp.]